MDHDPSGDLPDDWRELPLPWPVSTGGWSHADVAVTPAGELLTCHPDGGALVRVAADGTVTTVPAPITEAHGLTVVGDRVWVADVGMKFLPDKTGTYGEAGPGEGQVVQLDLDGQLLGRLPYPPTTSAAPYLPTSVIEDESGQVWVADGYGASELHRFDATGDYLGTLTGEESAAGRLDCPHALHLDERSGEPELYVADRARHRLVVFGLDGEFRREVAAGELNLPSAMATLGDLLVVAELHGRVTVLDGNDKVVGRSGADPAAPQRVGWPNGLDVEGRYGRPHDLPPASLNSPHGIVVDAQGRLVVSEWLIGGRLLSPVAPIDTWTE